MVRYLWIADAAVGGTVKGRTFSTLSERHKQMHL